MGVVLERGAETILWNAQGRATRPTTDKNGNPAFNVHMDSGYLYDPTGLGATNHGVIDVLCGWTLCGAGVPH